MFVPSLSWEMIGFHENKRAHRASPDGVLPRTAGEEVDQAALHGRGANDVLEDHHAAADSVAHRLPNNLVDPIRVPVVCAR